MKQYLMFVLLLGTMHLYSMIDGMRVELPVHDETLDVMGRKLKSIPGSRPLRFMGDSSLLSPAKLRSHPNALRTLQKSSVVVVSPVVRVKVAPEGLDLREEGLTGKEREALTREGETTSFVVKKPVVQSLSSSELQKQIQRAEDILVKVLKLAKKLHHHGAHAEDLSLVEKQLQAVEEFEERMSEVNAEIVQESGLPEKIAAVKAVLEDTISTKKGQLQTPSVEHTTLVVEPDDQEVDLALLKKQEQEREQLLKIDSYVSQPLVKQILAKGVDSYTPSQLAVNLELLGLRDFSLEEQLSQLPDGSSQKIQLEEIRQFEVRAFQRLEKEAPDFSTVQDKILDQIGSTGERGVFRKQAEEKIAFLESEGIMSRLDIPSQQYVQKAIEQFRQALHTSISLLLYPDERLVPSLEKSLSDSSGEVSANSGYDQQNELYRSLLQVEKAHKKLFDIVSGIALPLDFARGEYVSRLQEFEKICSRKLIVEDPSDKDIVQALKTVLSPDFAMNFVDSSKESEYVLGQQLSRAVGKEVLKIPLSSFENEDGCILSEMEGQQVRIAFETFMKEQGIDSSRFSQLPISWHYIPHDFLKEVGELWLRNFAKKNDDLSEVERFEKEQILCEAWQVARIDLRDATGRILLFRQMGPELMTYPMAKSLQFESLESKKGGKEIFSLEQQANPGRLLRLLPVKDDPLSPISAEEFGRESAEQTVKIEKTKEFPQSIQDFSTYCGVRQGAARAGVGFLEDMQTVLFDSERMKQLIEQKQLIMVVKELTAFQQMVLQGKSIDDFFAEWWQIELHQRAEVFKHAVRALDDAVTLSGSVDKEIQDFEENIAVVFGDYQVYSKKRVWQKREALVLEQSTVFQAQAKQWESWDTKIKGQKTWESDQLLLLRDQQQSLSQFLEKLPVLLKQVTDVIAQNPKEANVKKFKAYKKQLESAQKKYAPYLKRWTVILENNPVSEAVVSSKLVASYQQKIRKLIGTIEMRNEGTKWKSLDEEYAQAVAKDEGITRALLDRMVRAKADITQLLRDTPDLLEKIDEYQGILSRSSENEELLENLKIVREQLVAQQEVYKSYVAKWEKGLKKFGPHN